MQMKTRTLQHFYRAARLNHLSKLCVGCRLLHNTPTWRTDGVYPELTAMRVRIPWIQALRQQQAERLKNQDTIGSSEVLKERDLTPKRMSDSYHRVVLPLLQNPWLSDNYLNVNGNIRLGTLFMDLDALAGVVAYKHTGESVMTVTAAVDRITIQNRLTELCDLELSGEVTFATGRSSMEVSLQVARLPADQKPKPEDVILTCAFTMVSLDPNTKKPVNIAPLRVDTPEEKRIFSIGQQNYDAKKALLKTNLRKQTPNDEESDLIHAMWLKQIEYRDLYISVQKPDNVIYMDKTRLYNAQIMQPQNRNRHNFMIFGGYLLKQTFELAFSCVASFSHSRPVFIGLDPSTFQNPVPVGSVLYLTATIAYTDEVASSHDGTNVTRVQVRVDSKVRNVEHGETKPTGQFNYTFLVEKKIQIMPRTYSEFMIWVDARRRAKRVDALASSDPSSNLVALHSEIRDSVTE